MAGGDGSSSGSVHEKLKELDVSNEEAKKLTSAFEQPEFKQLFDEYVKEISDPSARAENDAYLRQFESTQSSSPQPSGVDPSSLIAPSAWLCVQSSSQRSTVYVNLCTSSKIGSLHFYPASGGSALSVPYSVGRASPLSDCNCSVDVVVSDSTKSTSNRDPRVLNAVIETALDAASHRLQLKLDKHSYSVLQSHSYYGPGDKPHMQSLQQQGSSNRTSSSSTCSASQQHDMKEKSEGSASTSDNCGSRSAFRFSGKRSSATSSPVSSVIGKQSGPAEPKCDIIERSYADFADGWQDKRVAKTVSESPAAAPAGELVARIEMPRADSARDVEVDCSERRLKVVLRDLYSLDKRLHRAVDEEQCIASWDSKRKRLEVQMPLLKQKDSTSSAGAPAAAAEEIAHVSEANENGEEPDGRERTTVSGTQDKSTSRDVLHESETMQSSKEPSADESRAEKLKKHEVGAAKKTENQRRWEEVHREAAKSRRGEERDEEDEEDKEIEQAEVEGKAKAKLAPRTTRPTTELELD